MREILFRGKRTDTGEWVEGYYLNRSNDKEDIHCIMEKYPATVGKRVIPETVGQYTGLTDNNGKRIFEGDIIKLEEDVRTFFRLRNGEVYFIGGSFLVGDNGSTNLLSTLYALTNQNWILRGEVIGNIHDTQSY